MAVNPEVLTALSAGISAEVASYVFYLEASKRPEAAEYKKTLEDLAAEEKRHFHILERQHSSLVRSEQWISTADVLKAEGLPDISEEMAASHKELVERVRAADSLKTILDIAYQLEVDARDMFAAQIDKTKSDEGRKMFTELTKFEEGHMRMIDRMRQKL
ncbi:MAG: ferritin family protein [candidate division Zixibacteria bacterium]|nr:ferritin family protein [candidate division Zixibacteria bacterium]